MRSKIGSLVLAMLFADNGWAVYSIELRHRATEAVGTKTSYALDTSLTNFVSPVLASPQLPMPTSTQAKPEVLQPHNYSTSMPRIETVAPFPNPLAAVPLSTNHPQPASTSSLSTGVKIGISIGTAFLILAMALLLVGLLYLRAYKRSRALQRAVDEVERGIELRRGSSATGSREIMVGGNESKDNMVLESRVEIVVEDGESERELVDVVGMWDGWDAGTDEEEWECERGRKAMSLPRREY